MRGEGERMRGLLLGSLLLGLAAPAAAEPPKDRDWGKALAEDARALHDDIAANHPGPVNTLDPGFAANNDRQLAIALERARTAKTYADYFFPLRIYVSSFNDGHMGFGAIGETPNDTRWPGFATVYDGSGAIVVATDEPEAPVPKGARLIGCDGKTAAQYAEATLGTMWGRWMLESQQQRFGPFLFIDEGSNLIPLARQCTFQFGRSKKTVAVEWRPLPIARTIELTRALRSKRPTEFAARTLADGTRWMAIPSFNGTSGSDAAKALPGMIRELKAERANWAAAPAIVLDLRGNGGGTSEWSRQIAVALWGDAALAALPEGPEVEVDWRASPANLAEIASFYADQLGSDGFSTEVDNWFRSVIAGLGVAIARKQDLWRQVEFDKAPEAPKNAAKPAAVAPLPNLAGPVFVLTDGSCGSACLDALDLWTALGAIHVGRTTSADTLYMEIRDRKLPSGLTSASIPMKVYRGRPRGSNQPAVPVHRFPGDIGDTAALERWISTLPERRR